MLRMRDSLICGLLLWGSARAAPPSAAASAGNTGSGSNDASSRTARGGRRLTGKFLHITDLHPDPFYKTYSSTTADAACHRQRGPAGIYGAETSGCDSPFALIDETFKWINDNIKDDIDFVIWTGDSARHDNDEEKPRTQEQVIEQNEHMVSKFVDVFGQTDDRHGPHDLAIPIVPTFGNNDIMPHNIFLGGPNRWTLKYLDIWRNFIPEAQRHQFQQGGWFSVEVIPGNLAVISLNTIYFFNSNSAVDGCANKREPGYEHMEWLRIQLQILRDRGMKAILMGHVPPARVDSKESWDETCWQKYTLFVRQFRDVIVGSLYGHMNIDHFMLQDFEHIEKDTESGRMASAGKAAALEGEMKLLEDGELTVASASDYLLNLRQAWAQLPAPPSKSSKRHSKSLDGEEEGSVWDWLMSMLSKHPKKDKDKDEKKKYLREMGGKYAERYAATLVAPSVVPNYFPTLRIFEYNITGLENVGVASSPSSPSTINTPAEQLPITHTEYLDDKEYLRDVETILKRKHKGKKDKKKPRKYKFTVPEGPSKSSPPGPAYSPQSLTWTRYVQYFANLTHINNDFVDPQQDEIDSSAVEGISANDVFPHTIFGLEVSSDGTIEDKRWKEGKHSKHQGKQPRPEPHPNEFVFEVEYDTREDEGFADLTVRRWVEYARKIGQDGSKAADVADVEEVEEEEEEEEFEDEEAEEEDEEAEEEEKENVESSKGGKKHKKGNKGKHDSKHKLSKEWFTFVKRAFVGTMDPHEIKDVFGTGVPEESREAMEL
ncbi:Endopolyphosphatase [Clathrospora elynae]|uniref:Endopolyphosphatase n=1 Tax=Clathrospora elynae TaxID=706981 RepID=A0A6A5SVK7_9PLEO|nr:Endopolyphosphatase [Clathrospora elynae]